MAQATFILVTLICATVGLAAYLHQPAVLLALALAPSLLGVLPFGLLVAGKGDMTAEDEDEEDAPQPMGFTQDVQSRA